jgi:3-keto-L-gulonate-6-phosphate decarboxylase
LTKARINDIAIFTNASEEEVEHLFDMCMEMYGEWDADRIREALEEQGFDCEVFHQYFDRNGEHHD